MKNKYIEEENLKMLIYRKREEGFDYCFDGYSDWSEVEDEKFHELRVKYLEVKKELDNYIMSLYDSVIEDIEEND